MNGTGRIPRAARLPTSLSVALQFRERSCGWTAYQLIAKRTDPTPADLSCRKSWRSSGWPFMTPKNWPGGLAAAGAAVAVRTPIAQDRDGARPSHQRRLAAVPRWRVNAPTAVIATRAPISARLGTPPTVSAATVMKPRLVDASRFSEPAVGGARGRGRSRSGPRAPRRGRKGLQACGGGGAPDGPPGSPKRRPRRPLIRRWRSEGVGYIDRPRKDWPPRSLARRAEPP